MKISLQFRFSADIGYNNIHWMGGIVFYRQSVDTYMPNIYHGEAGYNRTIRMTL